jgi:hypothetical protein
MTKMEPIWTTFCRKGVIKSKIVYLVYRFKADIVYKYVSRCSLIITPYFTIRRHLLRNRSLW